MEEQMIPLMENNRIAEARAAKNMNQDALAKKIGVSRISVSRYERGLMAPSVNILVRMSDALGVNMDYLIGRANSDIENS